MRLGHLAFEHASTTLKPTRQTHSRSKIQVMRYWWVNQKQTYRHEVLGGYLWSPKRKSNGDRNPFYDFMREVAPGDVVFSFADGLVKAIGIVGSHGYESPKPLEFGHTRKMGQIHLFRSPSLRIKETSPPRRASSPP